MDIITEMVQTVKAGEQIASETIAKFEQMRRAGSLTEKQVAYGESMIRKANPVGQTVEALMAGEVRVGQVEKVDGRYLTVAADGRRYSVRTASAKVVA